MTIESCLQLVDTMLPNGVASTIKRRWLSEIEGRVRVELLGLSPAEIRPFGADTPADTELCVPHPYDQLYWLYLMAMMDYMDGDEARYENSAALFNAAFQTYAKWLKRKGE